MRYKQPWGAKSNTATILLLPACERGFFYLYPVAHSHNVMGELPMQTLAVGGKLALSSGVLPPGRLIPLTHFPAQSLLATFLDTSLFVVVLWIVGTALPLHLALQSSFFLRIGDEFLAERDELGFPLAWDDSKGGGADIEPGGVVPDLLVLCERRLCVEPDAHI